MPDLVCRVNYTPFKEDKEERDFVQEMGEINILSLFLCIRQRNFPQCLFKALPIASLLKRYQSLALDSHWFFEAFCGGHVKSWAYYDANRNGAALIINPGINKDWLSGSLVIVSDQLAGEVIPIYNQQTKELVCYARTRESVDNYGFISTEESLKVVEVLQSA